MSEHPAEFPGPRSKSVTFHLVGHAHIDPVWLWDWREGYETVKATFRSALDRLQENPDMVFAHSSAAQYAWMEAHPVLLAEVRAAAERGQWEPVGGWWVETDVNLPHGEALARQALLGQRTFERLLGRRARVGFLPDSFGHPASLPQLLRLSGLEAFVFMRPGAAELQLPSNLFTWEGPDGSRILSARLETYSSSPAQSHTSLSRNLAWRPAHLDTWLGLYGVGNHGGGPTVRAIANLRELAESPDWPTLQLSSFENFFTVVRSAPAPTYRGGLQHHARGCYAAVAEIKRLNRHAEHALLRAEKLAALAGQHAHPYPHAELRRAWEQLLFNQFHDILAGSAIESAMQEAQRELGEVLNVAGRVAFAAMQALADQVDTRSGDHTPQEVIRSRHWEPGAWVTDYGDGVPLLIFNPGARERNEAIELELNDWHTPNLRLLDDTGAEVVVQRLPSESVNGEGRPRFVFRAALPPLGYRLYRVVDEAPAPTETSLQVSSTHLENEFWRLELDPVTGGLRSLKDKASNLEYLIGTAAQLQVVRDDSDTWGHGVRALRQLVGVFGDAEIEVTEAGPVRASLRVHTRWRQSRAVQQFTLYAGSREIGGQLTLDWHEAHHAAQLVFPCALSGAKATFSLPYGCAECPADGQEEPVQAWLDVSGTARRENGQACPAGLSLLSDGPSSASVLGGELRLTLLRSPVYAHHDPATLDPARTYTVTDQGRHTVRWQAVPHGGDWVAAGVPDLAEQLQQPALLTREYVHPGTLPQQLSAARLEGLETVSLTALKQAEDGSDLIVRLHEWGGRASRGALHWAGQAVPVSLRPHQVLGLRLGTAGEVQEVNFLEEEMK
ncbi:alpha-mannosidase [Deinococcus irradiatisoli]|uniref:Alpha-mannosidase n=1 Tax=Deinococcus irradiatisoli TaxID=2202254 RepID=A0A2Z3JD39_9DEIO|nr:glycoside hydrolase family 38 C-terminal domain-containing protein [Deinococcus irradiatisoli]AWN21956.1 alpha-mannosidase [Deinococcus irradiatisoli]